jgi:SAM-dependent methyltransferase
MTSRQFLKQQARLAHSFQRLGLAGETAFQTLSYQYVLNYSEKLSTLPAERLQTWRSSYQRVQAQPQITQFLKILVADDPTGAQLPEWYQFFVGRRYREDSGKFFTPKPIAAVMARLLPKRSGVVIIDPTCGGGTFLVEAAHRWQQDDCTLIANDVEPSLVELTMLLLSLAAPQHHIQQYSSVNIFDSQPGLNQWYGRVDYVLANPPFSLKIETEPGNSQLFQVGYRTSDALFLDTALHLLKPGGRLVCLLPHSLVANQEFYNLRVSIENTWSILGVICLPEGVFHLHAGTTTRADIVILDKKPVSRKGSGKRVFASVPSVGIRLNNHAKATVANDLELILNNPEIRRALSL